MRLVLVLAAVFLCFPSANFQFFDGLPLSKPIEAACLVLIGTLFLRSRSGYGSRPLERWRWVVVLVLLLGIGVKASFWTGSMYEGFKSCVQTPITAPPVGKCELSFENPFRRLGITRFDQKISFGPQDWNLHFLNSTRFNFYNTEKGKVSRDRFPIRMMWEGRYEATKDQLISIEYVGEGQVVIGGRSYELSKQYLNVGHRQFDVLAGKNPISVTFTFDDGYRTGDPVPTAPYATLRILTSDQDSSNFKPLKSSNVSRWNSYLAMVLDVSFLAILGLLTACSNILRGFLPYAPSWVGLLVAALFFILGCGASFSYGQTLNWWPWGITTIGLLIGLMFLRTRSRSLANFYTKPLFLFVLVISVSFAAGMIGPFNRVVYQTAGDDWLTYESFARIVLETMSLEGGEQVFYYQPLWRYLLFCLRMLFGDGHFLFVTTGVFLLNMAGFTASTCLKPASGKGQWLWLFASGILVAVINSPSCLILLKFCSSEFYTWVFFLYACAILFRPGASSCYTLGIVLIGCCYLARTNQAPGIAIVVFAFMIMTVRTSPLSRSIRVVVCSALIVLIQTH